MSWDINAQGNITLTPLVQYDTAILADIGLGLRLILARPEDQRGTGSLIVQMAMTVEQASELVRDLQKIIDRIIEKSVRVDLAIVVAGALVAIAILLAFRWQISSATGVVYRLDGWTGHVAICEVGVHDYRFQPIEFEK